MGSRMKDRTSHILRIAAERFLTVGYARSSVDSIANVAHVSKRDIYDVWPNKAALFSAVVTAIYSARDENWDLTTANLATRDALVALARRNIDLFLDDSLLGLFRASIELLRQHPEIAARIHAGRTTSWAGFGDYINRIVEQSGSADDISRLAAIRFGSLNVEGARHLMGAMPLSSEERQKLADRTADIFLQGAFHPTNATGMTQLKLEPYPAPKVDGQTVMRLSPERFDRLMDLTLEAFCKSGASGIKLIDVAQKAGISTATIYRHFPNKNALFRHAVQMRIHKNSLVDIDHESRIASEHRNFEAALRSLARKLLDRHLASENLAVQRLLIEEAVVAPDLSRAYYEQEVGITGRALSRLNNAFALKTLDCLSVRAFHTLATFGTRFLVVQDQPLEAERTALSNQAAAIFLHGIENSDRFGCQ